jgi:hypothetical protein
MPKVAMEIDMVSWGVIKNKWGIRLFSYWIFDEATNCKIYREIQQRAISFCGLLALCWFAILSL